MFANTGNSSLATQHLAPPPTSIPTDNLVSVLALSGGICVCLRPFTSPLVYTPLWQAFAPLTFRQRGTAVGQDVNVLVD